MNSATQVLLVFAKYKSTNPAMIPIDPITIFNNPIFYENKTGSMNIINNATPKAVLFGFC